MSCVWSRSSLLLRWPQTREVEDRLERSVEEALYLVRLECSQVIARTDAPSPEPEVGVVNRLGHAIPWIGKGGFAILVAGHQDAATDEVGSQRMERGVERHRHCPLQRRIVASRIGEQFRGEHTVFVGLIEMVAWLGHAWDAYREKTVSKPAPMPASRSSALGDGETTGRPPSSPHHP